MFIGIFQKSAHFSDFYVESGWIDWNIQNYIKTGPHFCPVCLTVLIQVEQISLNSIAPPSSIPIWIFRKKDDFVFLWIDAFCWIIYNILRHFFEKVHFFRLFLTTSQTLVKNSLFRRPGVKVMWCNLPADLNQFGSYYMPKPKIVTAFV